MKKVFINISCRLRTGLNKFSACVCTCMCIHSYAVTQFSTQLCYSFKAAATCLWSRECPHRLGFTPPTPFGFSHTHMYMYVLIYLCACFSVTLALFVVQQLALTDRRVVWVRWTHVTRVRVVVLLTLANSGHQPIRRNQCWLIRWQNNMSVHVCVWPYMYLYALFIQP